MGIIFIVLFCLFLVGVAYGINVLDIFLVGPVLFIILAVGVALIVLGVANRHRISRPSKGRR